MAHLVATNAYVLVNSVDLSAHVESVVLAYKGDAVEQTAMGDGTHKFLGGLLDWTLDINFRQDFAAAQVDASLFGIVGTVVTVEIKPVNTTRGPTNPSYTGSALLTDYTPIDAKVGALAPAPAKFKAGGTLSRLTA